MRVRRPKLSIFEALTLLISLFALAVSVWAAVQSRATTFRSRQVSLLNSYQTTLDYATTAYANASCTLLLVGNKSYAGQLRLHYADAAKIINDLRTSSNLVHSANQNEIDNIQSYLNRLQASLRRMHDATVYLRSVLPKDELQRVNILCGRDS